MFAVNSREKLSNLAKIDQDEYSIASTIEPSSFLMKKCAATAVSALMDFCEAITPRLWFNEIFTYLAKPMLSSLRQRK